MSKYLVWSPFKPVVKTARFTQPSYTARMLFKSSTLRDATLKEVLKMVKRECDLCKSYPSSSARRSGTKRNVMGVNRGKLRNSVHQYFHLS